ncbi:hypothetical protein F5B17DRAFT_384807 [Nemania serpens]|nr:hypothetical protein F5B17DRAFT_384807 [Nemania serpens]
MLALLTAVSCTGSQLPIVLALYLGMARISIERYFVLCRYLRLMEAEAAPSAPRSSSRRHLLCLDIPGDYCT